MLTEILATTAGTIAALDYIRNWRLDEIGLFDTPKIVLQNEQPLRPYQRDDTSKRLLLVQEGIGNFYLKEVVRIGVPEIFPDGTTAGHLEWNYVQKLPTLSRAYADDAEGLRTLLCRVGETLEEGDIFYFAVTRHGSFEKGDSFLRKMLRKGLRWGKPALADFYGLSEDQKRHRLTKDGEMLDCATVGEPGNQPISIDQFEEFFEPVVRSRSVNVLFFDTCFGGDFAQRMGKGNTIAISPVRPGKYLTMRAPSQNLLTGEWEDQSITSKSSTRYSFEQQWYQGTDLATAFTQTYDQLRWKIECSFLPFLPIINHPRMYVGNIDPATISLK